MITGVKKGKEPAWHEMNACRIARAVKLLDSNEASLLLQAYSQFPAELIDDMPAIESALWALEKKKDGHAIKDIRELLFWYHAKSERIKNKTPKHEQYDGLKRDLMIFKRRGIMTS